MTGRFRSKRHGSRPRPPPRLSISSRSKRTAGRARRQRRGAERRHPPVHAARRARSGGARPGAHRPPDPRSGRPLAATITLLSGTHAWFWKIAYDEAFARSSPGVQTRARSDRDAARRTRYRADGFLRDRRSSDDRSSVARAPGARRSADRAGRRIAGAVAHRAPPRSAAPRRARIRQADTRPDRGNLFVAQHPADDLAGRCHRQFIDESDLARIFVRRQLRPHEVAHLGRQRIGRLRSRT